MRKFFLSSASFPPSVINNSHSFFKVKKLDKVDRSDTDKSERIKLKFLMDPDNPASKYPPKVFYLQGCIPRGVYQVVYPSVRLRI
jgi:hypothetical protein